MSLPNLATTQGQPTLNALNQQAVASLASGSLPGVLQVPGAVAGMSSNRGAAAAVANVEVQGCANTVCHNKTRDACSISKLQICLVSQGYLQFCVDQ